MKIFLIALLSLFIMACVPGGSSATPGSSGTLQQASVDGFKVVSANISSTDLGLLNGSNPMRLRADGSLSSITFTVQNTTTGQTSTVSYKITALKSLADGYLALSIEGNLTFLVQISSGAVYNLPGANVAEMQMQSTSLYVLNDWTGILTQIDLNQNPPTYVNVNNPSQTASNSSALSMIFSSLNSSKSPFRYLSNNQYGETSAWLSPSFIFLGDGNIAAEGGSSGGPRVMIFNENASAYDCGNDNPYDNVGGGVSGGVIQAPDKNLYQIQIINSPNCALGGMTCGDQLVKYDTSSRSGMCGTSSVITSLDTVSHFPTNINSWITFKARYRLQDVSRYVIAPTGYLETVPDGMNGEAVNMNWVSLNLSAVPTNGTATNTKVVLDGDTLYWVIGNQIFYELLTSGSSAGVFVNSGNTITSFDVIHGHVIFTTAQGSYKVSSPGAASTQIQSNVDLTSSVKF